MARIGTNFFHFPVWEEDPKVDSLVTTNKNQDYYVSKWTKAYPFFRPGVQESEKNFFRMIFHSTAIFDGTGFYALYQFAYKSEKDFMIFDHLGHPRIDSA